MAEPITNLEAMWTPGVGIQLNWTDASDVSNESNYNIYVLQNVQAPSPTWVLIGSGLPRVVSTSTPGSSVFTTLEIAPPTPNYFFPQSQIINLTGPGSTVAPHSFAFSVIHVDGTGASSIATSISAFLESQTSLDGFPHFPNAIAIDGFGQFVMNPQDSFEEISDSVEMVLGTLPGQRIMAPEYGIPDLTFTRMNAHQLASEIDKWENRANALVGITYDDNNNATVSVKIKGGNPA